MTEWRKKLNAWLVARSPRERWLVYVVGFVVIVALGDQLVTAPQQSRVQSARAQLEAERQHTVELQAEIAKLSAQLTQDPNRVLRERIAELKVEHATLDAMLRELTVGLIQPTEMTQVLREMLADEKGLQLVRLANGQGEPVLLVAPPAGRAPANEEPRLYRHTLEMEVQGGYLDALRYLKRLEALPWTFYWDSVELRVDQYPKSRFVIRISTLGLREGWIGV